MFPPGEIEVVREALGRYVAGFDAAVLSTSDAERVLESAIAVENMAAVLKALAGRRAAESGSWRTEGERSPAHQLARKAGIPISRAQDALKTAERLGKLAATDGAARRGELSLSKLAPLSEAATADPAAESRLLDLARVASVGEVADECARTKAAAQPSDDKKQEEIHAGRSLRQRATADGGAEVRFHSTREEVAEVVAIARGFATRLFRKAEQEGREEPAEAHLADGLLAAMRLGARAGARIPRKVEEPGPFDDAPAGADEAAGDAETEAGQSAGGPDHVPEPSGHTTWSPVAPQAGVEVDDDDPLELGGPVRPAKVIVRIDWDALMRGFPTEGELCEISGLGPVPVAAVQTMVSSGNAVLAAVLTKGKGVARVAHLGRSPNAAQRSALEWLSPTCTRLGCNNSVHIEIDHRLRWADTGFTLLELLDGLCPFEHRLKTFHGWALVAGVGKRAMVPPDDPRHPEYCGGAPAEEVA